MVRSSEIPKVFASDPEPTLDEDCFDNRNCLDENRCTTRRLLVRSGIHAQEQQWQHEVDDRCEEKGQLVSDIFLGIGGREQVESTNVDKPVEDEHCSCAREFWVSNHLLARFELFRVWKPVAILIQDSWGDVRFEDSRAKGEQE